MSKARIIADYAGTGAATDLATQTELNAVSTVASAALPKAGGAMTGAITTNSTFDGVDVAVRDALHAPKASPALTGTATAVNLTVSGDLVPSTPLSHRNMIINGGMQVAQRGTSFSPTTGVTYLMDMWRSAHGSSFNFDTTITQVETGLNDTGQTYCMKVEADSVVSPTGSHNGGIGTVFEGQDLQHLQYGGSNAKDMVLSFWAKVSTNAVGTYAVQPRFTDPSGGYHSQYHAISLTTTWTKYQILIPANGSALTTAIRNTNAVGLEIFWWLCAGADDLVSATSTWNDVSAYKGITGQTNFLDSADNEFYLTGVQLELGSNATPFEHRSYGEELLRCSRYFQKYGEDGATSGMSLTAMNTTGHTTRIPFNTEMRATPTGVVIGSGINSSGGSVTNTTWAFYHAGAWKGCSAVSINTLTKTSFRLEPTSNDSCTSGGASVFYGGSQTALTFSAEL